MGELDFSYKSEHLVTPDTGVIWVLMGGEECVSGKKRGIGKAETVMLGDRHKDGPSLGSHDSRRGARTYTDPVREFTSKGTSKGIYKGQLVPHSRDFPLWSGSQVPAGSPGEGSESCCPSGSGKQGWQTPQIPKISPLSLVCWLGLPHFFPSF